MSLDTFLWGKVIAMYCICINGRVEVNPKGESIGHVLNIIIIPFPYYWDTLRSWQCLNWQTETNLHLFIILFNSKSIYK